jgi:DNA-binding LacI/PurR family transcriptional regulator
LTSRLRDIAALAGVSEATVSRVLNERPGVARSTRETVLTAVDRLGYDRPSRLRRKSAGLIGVIAPELSNPIFPLMAQVIESRLVAKGFTPVLCTQTQGHLSEEQYVALLVERGVAGIIFVSGVHTNYDCRPARYNQVRDRGVPVVLVNGYLAGVDAPFVSTDDRTAIDLAVGHLVGLGHTLIGLAVGPERYTPVIRKVAQFHRSMAAVRGVHDATGLIEHASFTVEGGGVAAGGPATGAAPQIRLYPAGRRELIPAWPTSRATTTCCSPTWRPPWTASWTRATRVARWRCSWTANRSWTPGAASRTRPARSRGSATRSPTSGPSPRR